MYPSGIREKKKTVKRQHKKLRPLVGVSKTILSYSQHFTKYSTELKRMSIRIKGLNEYQQINAEG